MVLILMVTDMMMLMMAMTLSMEIRMLDGPISENVLQILDVTTPNLGFEGVQISVCCRTQWKVTRPRLRSDREETHHLAWSSSALLPMEPAALQRMSEMKKFIRLLLQIETEEVPDLQLSLDADHVWR